MILEKRSGFAIDMTKLPDEAASNGLDSQRLVEIRNVYHAAIREISTKLEILDNEFQVKNDYNPIHHMESRLKSVNSITEKILRKGWGVSEDSIKSLTDIAGVRVICNYIDDIYTVADLLLRQDDIQLIRRKDYIEKPKESGYRSLHLVVLVPVFLALRTEKIAVEIQIRTIAMDTWASLEHELKYKSEGELSREAIDELKKCATEMKDVDERMQKIHRLLED